MQLLGTDTVIASMTSDGNGEFRFDRLEPGEYALSGSKEGVGEARRSAVLPPEHGVEADLVLKLAPMPRMFVKAPLENGFAIRENPEYGGPLRPIRVRLAYAAWGGSKSFAPRNRLANPLLFPTYSIAAQQHGRRFQAMSDWGLASQSAKPPLVKPFFAAILNNLLGFTARLSHEWRGDRVSEVADRTPSADRWHSQPLGASETVRNWRRGSRRRHPWSLARARRKPHLTRIGDENQFPRPVAKRRLFASSSCARVDQVIFPRRCPRRTGLPQPTMPQNLFDHVGNPVAGGSGNIASQFQHRSAVVQCMERPHLPHTTGSAMPLGIDPLNDFAFKKTFGTPENRACLIHLLNATLRLKEPIVEVALDNPFNPKDFQEDKLSLLDIKAIDRTGAIYDVEVQLDDLPGPGQRDGFLWLRTVRRPAQSRARIPYGQSGLHHLAD